jgi:hypothetical protein
VRPISLEKRKNKGQLYTVKLDGTNLTRLTPVVIPLFRIGTIWIKMGELQSPVIMIRTLMGIDFPFSQITLDSFVAGFISSI